MSLVGPFVHYIFLRIFSMCMRARPFFVLVLCGLLFLGHIPAWIHYVEFHGAEDSVSLATDEPNSCEHCHPICRVLATKAGQAKELRDRTSSAIRGFETETHDDEHCILCQSLVHSVSALVPDGNGKILDEFSYFSALFQPFLWQKSAYSIQQPRGPPALS